MKRILCWAVLGAAVMLGQVAWAEEAPEQQDLVVMEKLDRILKNQSDIIQKLDEVKEEVRITKLRATRT